MVSPRRLAWRRKVPEHANLALDVAPFARSFEVIGQDIVKILSHSDDPVGHSLHLTLPLGVKLFVAQNGVGNASTVGGRVRVHRTDNDLQLAVNARLLIGIGGDQGEGSDTLAIKTHVLGERLAECDLVALRNEVTNGEGVAGSRARSKALVCHVEEGEKFTLLADV